jgi:hypothetical protein
MKITPCAISIHPPCIHIHSLPGTEAGCQDVPEPSCGEGSGDAIDSSIDICIPAIDFPAIEESWDLSWEVAAGLATAESAGVLCCPQASVIKNKKANSFARGKRANSFTKTSLRMRGKISLRM